MNKRLFIASLLILTNLILFSASGSAPRARARIANQELAEPISLNTLDQMQQIYASQGTNDRKALYINYILEDAENNITIEQKISQIKNLATIIANDLSLHRGWLYNNDQAQVDWLQTQQTKIAQKLSQLQWQAKSWGMKTLYSTAWWTTIYLGVILAAYLAQNQMQNLNPEYEQKAYGELAWMPIETILNLSQKSANIVYEAIAGETTQKNVKMAVGMAIAAAKTAGEFGSEAIDTIGRKGADRAQKDLHAVAKKVVKSTEPTPPSWSEIAFGKANGNKSKEDNATPQKQNKPAAAGKASAQQEKTDAQRQNKANASGARQQSVTQIHTRQNDINEALYSEPPAREPEPTVSFFKGIANSVIDTLNERNIKAIDSYVQNENNLAAQQAAADKVALAQLREKQQNEIFEEAQRVEHFDQARKELLLNNLIIEKNNEYNQEVNRRNIALQKRLTAANIYENEEKLRVIREKYLADEPAYQPQSKQSNFDIDPMP